MCCMKKLIQLEKNYIPRGPDNYMYIRPTYISMTDQLGVIPACAVKIFMIMSPVHVNEIKPLKVLCTDDIIKKHPESFGHLNLPSNFGPILEHMKLARQQGYDDILFLFNDNITELSEMNVFIHWEDKNGTKEIVTPALDGTVLPGITRDSVMKLGRELGINVSERHISIKEVLEAIKENRMLEMFGTSTMNGINSIQEINYNNTSYKLPGDFAKNKRNQLCQMMYDSLLKIKLGIVEHPWVTTVE